MSVKATLFYLREADTYGSQMPVIVYKYANTPEMNNSIAVILINNLIIIYFLHVH